MEHRRARRGRPRGLLPLLLLAVLSASGCGSLGTMAVLNPTQEKWEQVVSARGVDPADVPIPMWVTPEIQAAAEKVAGPGADRERLKRLQAALLDRSAYAFEYDTVATFTAQEAFAARRGNCVSFTNLFIAFGRALGIPLQAALLYRRAHSEKEGDLVMVYNHMVAVHPKGRYVTVYDFYMSRDDQSIEVRMIDDLAVAAIAASNRGVEALRAGNLDRARVFLEQATHLQPALPDLYSNLGIVYWRQGDVEGAYRMFRQGLEIDPSRPTLLNNLAALHLAQGKRTEARAALAAAATRETTPFLLVVRGDLEMAAGNTNAALRAYKRAHREGRDLLEPLLGIARAEMNLGHRDAARRALRKAEKLQPRDPQVLALLESLTDA